MFFFVVTKQINSFSLWRNLALGAEPSVYVADQLTLNGGTLSLLGNSAAPAGQTSTAALTLGSGNSTVNVTAGAGQTATLTFGSLTRTAGATANFTAGLGQTLGGSPKVVFTAAPTVLNGVLKGATTTDA